MAKRRCEVRTRKTRLQSTEGETMIEWIENGEWKSDEPEPRLREKILKALIIIALLLAGPTYWRHI